MERMGDTLAEKLLRSMANRSSLSSRYRRGSWKEAMAYFNEVLDIRYFVHSRVVIDSLTGLIISNTLLDKKSEAEEVMDVLENYTIGLGDFFKSFMWSCRTRYYMLTNNRKAVVNQLKVYKPGVLDLVLWLDIPEITHARALVYEGSDANLKQAEEKLAKLEGVTSDLQNKVH